MTQKTCESLPQITTGARRSASDLLPRCRTIYDLKAFKLGDQETNRFPDPDNIKFFQSPYNSLMKASKRKPLVYLPVFPSTSVRDASHRRLRQDAIDRVARKPQTNVNLETIIPRLKAVILPFKIPDRQTSPYGLVLFTPTAAHARFLRILLCCEILEILNSDQVILPWDQVDLGS